MAASKEKSTLALQALGYHGTTLEAAKKIITDGFRPSSNPWEWLGHGIYFWQDAPNRARDWAKEVIRGYRAACVEGKRITTGSPIYDRSHVQLAVIDQDTILQKWIVE